jgi:hypothetical protein
MLLRALRWLAPLSCTFALAGAGTAATTIDLADIVGGGDGSGNGGNAGVDVTDGSTTTSQTGPITAPTNTFVPAANPLIDGVVIPDGGGGGAATVPISSTGLTVTGISDSTELGPAHTWDHVWNGTNFGTTTTWVGAVLGMHANKGVTFDLEAIGAAHGGFLPASFSAWPITGSSPSAQVDYYAFVDGVLVASASLSGEDAFAPGFESSIPPDARFLTLLTSSDGLITGDWSGFLDPTLELVQPEPLTVGQIDTFDAGLDRWERGQHVTENGNGFLRIPGPEGAYIITFFSGAPWAGDYVAVGVRRLRISLRNDGPATLTIYVAFGTTSAPTHGGDWLATATPVTLAPGGGWNTYDIPIQAADLVAVQGSATYESVMANVRTLRILHNDHPDARALTVPLYTDLDIDNVEALPEPASAPALGAGALLLRGLARRRRSERALAT